MKKRILCLVLALLLVLPMLVACDEDDVIDNINEEASRYTSTLNMWMITESADVSRASKLLEKGITPKKLEDKKLTAEENAELGTLSESERQAWEQLYLITQEINKLTKSKYKIQLNIKYFTEAEYYTAVEKAYADYAAYIAEHKTVIAPNTSNETVLNEYGIPELKYPATFDFQVDILFLGNYDKYVSYVANGWLADMRVQLSESAMKLYSYVDVDLLEAAEINNGIYAYPNNHAVGEYVFLVADKDMMEAYDVNGDLTGKTLYDTAFKSYLDYVKTAYPGTTPLYVQDGVELDYSHYWSVDVASKPGQVLLNPGTFSIFGDSYYNKGVLGNTNLLTDVNFMTAMANKAYYEKTAGYITNDENANAAVRVVKGGYELKAQYEAMGYKVIAAQQPKLTGEDVYSSMFSIGSRCVEQTRAAEIITYLSTNSEVRNLLQYGVEGENYTLKTEEKTVVVNGVETKVECSWVEMLPTNKYVMDLSKTGNTFIAYAESEEAALDAYFGKLQNLDMTVYPTLGFVPQAGFELDAKNIQVMTTASAKLKALMDDMDYSEIMALHAGAKACRNTSEMASLLFNTYFGMDGSYNGFNFLNSDLKNALDYFALTEIREGTGNTTPTQSIYALYKVWCG